MKCPLCSEDEDMRMEYVTMDPRLPISRVLNVLQCVNCGYWLPCSTKGEVPRSREEEDKWNE